MRYGDDGRTHSRLSGDARALVMDRAVGNSQCDRQAVCRDRLRGIEGKRPSHLADVVRCADELDDRVDRQLRGDLTRIVSTHAVGHDEQPKLEIDKMRVLVR